MQLFFTQREFSWDASYTIADSDGETVFLVEGLEGRCLSVKTPDGEAIGEVKMHKLLWTEKVEMHAGGQYVGSIRQEFTFRGPKYIADSTDWWIKGSALSRRYRIWSEFAHEVASVVKDGDDYTIALKDPVDALRAVLLVLALDAYFKENERKRR